MYVNGKIAQLKQQISELGVLVVVPIAYKCQCAAQLYKNDICTRCYRFSNV